jgi:hypothetical protein
MYLLAKVHKWQLLVILLKNRDVHIILEDLLDSSHVKEEEITGAEADGFTRASLVEVITAAQLRPLLPFQRYQQMR